MSKQNSEKPSVTDKSLLTRDEMDQVGSRIADVRCALELASRAASGTDAYEQSKVAGLLDMAVREIEQIEVMFDSVALKQLRARAEVANG